MVSNIRIASHYLREGYNFAKNNEFDKAIENYMLSLMFCNSVEARLGLATVYYRQGDTKEAIKQAKRALKINPDSGSANNDLGAYLIQINKFEEARNHLQKAILDKTYISPHFAYYNLGYTFVVTKDFDSARRLFEHALQLKPNYQLALTALEDLNKKLIS